MHFTCAARTDVGIVRSGNEDNYLMLAERGVFIVADGMGGHAAGEVASEMAVRITSSKIGSMRGLSDEQAGERVSEAIRAANDAIFERTLSEHDKRGMGTTATVLVLMPRRYLIGQVGDSRAYLLRGEEFQQLTKDHSYVQEQVDAGLLTPDQARVHPYSNVITRCVGASMDVVPDIYFGSLEAGDVLLLASDGLTGMLEDEQLTRILSADGGPQHWVDRMVTEANRRGGLDNITAIVIRIDSVDGTTASIRRPPRPPAPPDPAPLLTQHQPPAGQQQRHAREPGRVQRPLGRTQPSVVIQRGPHGELRRDHQRHARGHADARYDEGDRADQDHAESARPQRVPGDLAPAVEPAAAQREQGQPGQDRPADVDDERALQESDPLTHGARERVLQAHRQAAEQADEDREHERVHPAGSPSSRSSLMSARR